MSTLAPLLISLTPGLPVLARYYRDGEPGPRVVMSDPFVCRELSPGHPSYAVMSSMSPLREQHAGWVMARLYVVEHECEVQGFEDFDVAAVYFGVGRVGETDIEIVDDVPGMN